MGARTWDRWVGARAGGGGEREQGMDGSNDNGWMGARAGWMDGSEGRGG